MANSLLAHLYSRIRGSQEDVATISLQYLLSQSVELNRSFTHLVSLTMEKAIDSSLQYCCQSVGEDRERPDMAGVDSDGREVLLCEMKFYAGLTDNQPLSYLKRLREHCGLGLVFICPKSRLTSLWSKLKGICCELDNTPVNDRCVCVDGVYMAILTWTEVLDQLRKTAASLDVQCLSDIQQLEGYCAEMDSDAFIPFAPEDLTAENAKKEERYYEVIDHTIDLICADERYKTSKKGLKRSPSRRGYAYYFYLDDFAISLDYDRPFWKNNSSVETPFWVSIRASDWSTPKAFWKVFQGIRDCKKENTEDHPYLALEPLTDATLDEVCEDMKRQILEYVELFR